MTILKIEHISKIFDKNNNVLTNINLEVEKGECIALLGKNGAGKSTLLKILLDKYKATTGKIDIKYQKKDLGYLPEKNNFPTDIKVKELLEFFKSYGEKSLIDNIIDKILNFSEEQLNQFAVSLSGGQQRLLDFCLAIINQPKLLIIDEPTSAMDTNTRKNFWNIVTNLKKRGTTIIFTTHYIEEVDYTADRVILLDKGVLMADDTPYKLRMLDNKKILRMDRDFYNKYEKIFSYFNFILNTNTVEYHFDPAETDGVIEFFNRNNISLSKIELTNSSLLSTIFNIHAN